MRAILFLSILACATAAHAQTYSQTTHYRGGWSRVGAVTGPLGIVNYPVYGYQAPATVTQTYQAVPAFAAPRPGYAQVYTWTGYGWAYDGEFRDAPNREAVIERDVRQYPSGRTRTQERVYYRGGRCTNPLCDCPDCDCVNCRCGR